jgi:Histidine kinase-, DNA gyrase B-, and HSP90-like ATPase
MSGKYVMTISRMTVDKLGVKLYDRVSAVIAELVANAYDADAKTVQIEAPMGHYLATVQQGQLRDSGYKIIVRDDGTGMDPAVVNPFYLKVGGERRKDRARGDTSKIFGRRVMGRKGVGKLAPFGICGTIEVISSGGDLVEGFTAEGEKSKGYKTAHFIMRRDQIMTDEDTDYSPEVGPLDETVRSMSGTTLILSNFTRRQVPEMQSFSRQLAQRFGLTAANWCISLVDSLRLLDAADRVLNVGAFSIDTMENTRVTFSGTDSQSVDLSAQNQFVTIGPDNKAMPLIRPGFAHYGRFYPLLGWIAYARESYRDDLMAGVRIYCRGKIAAQTNVFNRKSGFTGEYQVRSYLVGELQADWLDEGDDLIQTDRRDILWSDELGQKFEEWGQSIVQLLGTLSREPLKKRTYDEFLEVGNVVNRVESAYPGERWKPVRETTMRIARLMGERLRDGEVKDQEHVDSLVQLSLMLGPHVQLDDALREAAAEESAPMAVVIPPEYKRRFQLLLLPSGYVMGRLGTARKGSLFSVFSIPKVTQSIVVPLTGQSWNQLAEEITAFAQITREASEHDQAA